MNSFHLITEIRRSFILEYLATPFDINHSLTRETTETESISTRLFIKL